jgi:hypothetical protein
MGLGPRRVTSSKGGWSEGWEGLPGGRFGFFHDRTLKGLALEAIASEWSIDDTLLVRSQEVIEGKSVYLVKRAVGKDANGVEIATGGSVFIKQMSESFLLKIMKEAKKYRDL